MTIAKKYQLATLWTVMVFLLLAVPTDIVENPLFSREVPVRWWELPTILATSALTFTWFAVQREGVKLSFTNKPISDDKNPQESAQNNSALVGGLMITLFAVACPVCNKIVLLLLGFSGAMGFWAPAQPYIAILSVAALALATILRWRAFKKADPCATGQCETGCTTKVSLAD